MLNKLVEGWAMGAVARWQSGRIFQVQGGAFTFNQYDSGVELIGITPGQIQQQLGIRKTPDGRVFYWPASLLDPAQQYANMDVIHPCTTPGAFCQRLFLYGPSFFRSDINVVKRIRITERVHLEYRAEFLNAFNNVNFMYGLAADAVRLTSNRIDWSSNFGRVTNAYRDFSKSEDPGGRIIQMVLRINF